MQNRVNNTFPKMSAPYRLAIIGEAPGKTEEELGTPFVGASGELLTGLLQDAGLQRDACFIGNICQYRPPDNDIKKFAWTGTEIQQGISTLKLDLEAFKPHMCLLLGNSALHAFKSPLTMPKKPTFPISSWRGSLFLASTLLPGTKCLATYHPASLLRVFNDCMLVRYDLRRVRKEADFPTLTLPQRTLITDVTVDYLTDRFNRIRTDKPKITIDIEGGCYGIKCCSVAITHQDVFIVPFENMDGTSYWSEEDELKVWEHFSNILSDSTIPKILQYGLYDRFVFAWAAKLLVRGQVDDTLLKHWEFQCEMDKGLDVQTSIYTREPFYKTMIVANPKAKTYWARLAGLPNKTFWTYCCLDSAVTRECSNVLDACLKGSSIDHYQFNMSLLNPFLYMELRGIRIDRDKRDARIYQLEQDAVPLQAEMDAFAGHPINVKSPPQMTKFLYEELKLPTQYKRGAKPDEFGNVPSTTEYEAILKLAHKSKDDRLMKLIKLKELYKRASDLRTLTTNPDGRIRFAFNPVGSVTGRVTCSESPSGSGTNGQTVVKANPVFDHKAMQEGARDLLTADDDDHWIWECDLSGADGWTVAAHCARLGDRTMLDDLLFGLKIPYLAALTVNYGVVTNQWDRPTLKEKSKEIVKDSPIHFSMKQVQHGTNYGMKPPTVAMRVFLESYGQISITTKQAEQYQQAYLTRYRGVLRWHDWMRKEIYKGHLITATGHKRIFTGRKGSDDTLREALSDEPQEVTTYATNMALLKLWRDPDNRVVDNNNKVSLRIEPLHQVHDALVGQFKKTDLAWAIGKIKSYFDNTITIAGIPIKIPFEGHYGPSWGELADKTRTI